jgi:hypothetical protein
MRKVFFLSDLRGAGRVRPRGSPLILLYITSFHKSGRERPFDLATQILAVTLPG